MKVHRSVVLVFITALASCKSSQVKLNAEQQARLTELASINPANDSRPADTSIIDVHTHTFNARYLPLEGILHGKRDAFLPVTGLISDRCATLIAQALIDRTELAAIPGQPGIARKPDTRALRELGEGGPVCRLFLNLIDKAIRAGAWDDAKSMTDKVAIIDKVAAEMNPFEKLAVRAAANMMGMEDHITEGEVTKDQTSGIQAAVRFLWTATQNDAEMAHLFHEMHKGARSNGPITMISHMMDLAPVYAQTPDNHALLDFETQQVKRMEYYQSQPSSHLLYFVAYNPYRDHLQGSSSALDLVRNAITKHGAKGVKVYPPSGYRAIDNDIKDSPTTLFTSFPGSQWRARYGGLGKTRSEQNVALDAGLNTLLEWCIANDVPVFTHSGYGEFEARKGYGVHNASPEFWGKFLASHSKPGAPCKLRLCLGHAGGDDFWFSGGTHSDWGQCAYDLCTQYPNVYCEITTFDAMLDHKRQAYFVDRLGSLFAKPGQRYPFATKLMYGTDWYLPDKGKPAAVLLATQQAFLHPKLSKYYGDYFSGNARRYLKLE